MQRLVSLKLASKFTRKALSESTAISQTTSFSSKTHQTNFVSHPWMSQSNNTVSPKARCFVSNPLLAKRFFDHSTNALLTRVVTKGFSDFKLAFQGHQFPKRGFNFDSSSRSRLRDWRSWLRDLSPHDLVMGLLLTNVGVFILWRIADATFMYNNFTISVENFKSGRLHTLITAAFSHIHMGHIIHNMIGLYFFGIHLGHFFGSEYLLKLYLAGGLAGSVCYLVHSAFLASSLKGQMWQDPLRTPGLGASGAVNAIILLDIFLYPRSTVYFFMVIPMPAVLLGIYLIGNDVLGMIKGDTPASAHLGGFAVAAIAWARIRRGRF